MHDKLTNELRLSDPDEVYAGLIAAHRGLSESESLLFNARLILLLANHIGDGDIVEQAVGQALEGVVARRSR